MKKVACIYTASGALQNMIEDLLKNSIEDEVEFTHIVDSGLIRDITANHGVTEEIRERLGGLFTAARAVKPDAIVCTCSSIGALADEEAAQYPKAGIYRIDYPMCREAVSQYSRIAVMATLETTVKPSCDLLQKLAKEEGKEITVTSMVASEAFTELMKGNRVGAAEIILNLVEKAVKNAEALVLAQASMGMFAGQIKERYPDLKLYNSPETFAAFIGKELS